MPEQVYADYLCGDVTYSEMFRALADAGELDLIECPEPAQ